MQLTVTAQSHVGQVRKNNEDKILVLDNIFTNDYFSRQLPLEGNLVFAVADGMGGHNAGEYASDLVLRSLKSFMETFQSKIFVSSLKMVFENWALDTFYLLQESSADDERLAGMGTTLTALLFMGGHYFYLHAGDSRLYKYRNGKLSQLTRDHTQAVLLNDPSIPRNFLGNCIGGTQTPFIDMEDISDQVKKGDRLLLCSDGLFDMISDEEITGFIHCQDVKAMVDKANERGGKDNVSVILISIED